MHTSMLMLGWQRRLSSTFSMLFPVPWQAGSGRVSLVRFGILGRHFAEGWRKKGSCLRVEAFLAGIWVWEQLLCECVCVCVRAGVWVLKLLPSTAPIRSQSSNNKQGNRNNNYGHLGLGDVIFFLVIISTFAIATALDSPQDTKFLGLAALLSRQHNLSSFKKHTYLSVIHMYVCVCIRVTVLCTIRRWSPLSNLLTCTRPHSYIECGSLTHLSRQHFLLFPMKTQSTVKSNNIHISSRH